MIDTPAETPEVDDVRADVVAAIAQLNGDTPEVPQGDSLPSEAAPGTDDLDPPDGRVRDPATGRFVAKDNGAETQPVPDTVSDADPAKVEQEQPSTAVTPPVSWSADAKTEWSKLSPAIQAAVLKREAEINDGGRKWSEERQAYDALLAPVQEMAQRAGVDPKEGFNRLLQWNSYLDADPSNAIRELAQTYGVDLSKLATNPNVNPQPQPALSDPRALQQLIQQEAQRVVQSTFQAQSSAALGNDIAAFASAPGHEHFDRVKGVMGQILNSMPDDPAKTSLQVMQEAYEQAVWAFPDIRASVQASRAAEASAKKRAEDAARVANARQGAISVTGSPVNGAMVPTPDYPTTLDATRAAWAAHTQG